MDSAEICTTFIEAITCMDVLLWIRQGTGRENMLSFISNTIDFHIKQISHGVIHMAPVTRVVLITHTAGGTKMFAHDYMK